MVSSPAADPPLPHHEGFQIGAGSGRSQARQAGPQARGWAVDVPSYSGAPERGRLYTAGAARPKPTSPAQHDQQALGSSAMADRLTGPWPMGRQDIG